MGDQILTTVLLVVTGQGNGVFGIVQYRHQYIGLRLTGMEIESEEEPVPGKDQDLFLVLQEPHVTHALGEDLMLLGQLHHVLIEVVQPLVFQEAVLLQAPLTAAEMEAPAVAFPGEVDPLRMTELIAHEVQIALTAAGKGEQPDQLVQSDGPVDHRVVGGLVHIRIHGSVCQAEDHGLIAHQSLVMTLHIGDSIFAGAAQAHIAPHLADVPILVLLLLYSADPHIGQAHAQPVVEADTAVLDG